MKSCLPSVVCPDVSPGGDDGVLPETVWGAMTGLIGDIKIEVFFLAAGSHAEPTPDRPGYFAIKSNFRSRSVSVALNSAGFSSMSQWPTPSIVR